MAEAEAGPSSSRACHHVSLNDLVRMSNMRTDVIDYSAK